MEYFAVASVVVTQDFVVPNVGRKELNMTKKNPQAERAREIERQWHARPLEQRSPSHVEDFAEEMRRYCLYLKGESTPNVHAVRALLRAY